MQQQIRIMQQQIRIMQQQIRMMRQQIRMMRWKLRRKEQRSKMEAGQENEFCKFRPEQECRRSGPDQEQSKM